MEKDDFFKRKFFELFFSYVLQECELELLLTDYRFNGPVELGKALRKDKFLAWQKELLTPTKIQAFFSKFKKEVSSKKSLNLLALDGIQEFPPSLIPQFSTEFEQHVDYFFSTKSTIKFKENSTDHFSSLKKASSKKIPSRYSLREELGEGGMGIVRKVHDLLLKRDVALKTIKGNLSAKNLSEKQKALWARLNREAFITAELEHPNIVPLYDMGHGENEELFFTMRQIPGKTLRELLFLAREKEIELTENRRLGIFIKICEAVGYAHSKGVIHRDLKPENIMVGEFGEVYVMDWGLAKKLDEKENTLPFLEKEENEGIKTEGGVGTTGYMSPEQAECLTELSPQADIFSLGQLLLECFTLHSYSEELQLRVAERRYQNFQSHYLEISKKNQKSLSSSLSILLEQTPADIIAIAKKAKENNTAKRYQTIKELTEDIERYQHHNQVSARDYPFFEILGKWLKRNRQKAALAFAGMALILISLLFIWWNENERIKQQIQNSLQKARQATRLFEKDLKNSISLHHAINAFNTVLNLTANAKIFEQEKHHFCSKALLLCYENKDYKLAQYLVEELITLRMVQTKEKIELQQKLQQEKTKQLKQHIKKLEEWIVKAQNLKKGEEELALLEISKMEEKEIFERLMEIAEEGLLYYLEDQQKEASKKELYRVMIRALGKIENPNTGAFFLRALKDMVMKMQTIPHIKRNGFPDEIDYMVSLVEALTYSSVEDASSIVNEARKRMGPLGIFWKKTEAYQLRLDHFQLRSKKQPKTAIEYFKRAISKSRTGDYKGALKDYTKALSLKPRSAKIYIERGITKTKTKDFKGAIEDYNQAIRLAPKQNNAYTLRGSLKNRQGKQKEALTDFTKAIELKPQFENNYLLRGALKISLKRYEEATQDFSKAISLNPFSSLAYIERGKGYLSMKKYSKAILDFNEAIKLNPRDEEAYNVRGYTKKAQKDFSGAIEDFTQGLRINPQIARNYYNRGNLYYSLKQYPQALSDFNKVIKLTPDVSITYYKKGKIKSIQGKFEEAAKNLSKAIQIKSDESSYYRQRGHARKNQKDFKRALEDYSKAIQLEPDVAKNYEYRGEVLLQLKEFKKALLDFEKITKLKPNFVIPIYNSASCYLALGDEEKALLMMEKGFALNFNANVFTNFYYDILIKRATKHYREKKLEKAIDVLNRLQKNTPSKSEFSPKIKKRIQQIEVRLKKTEKK